MQLFILILSLPLLIVVISCISRAVCPNSLHGTGQTRGHKTQWSPQIFIQRA